MTECDVVVIGAGLAGLRAATDLLAGGLSVVVVEARDRVGGRVLSHTFADGQWCERGAEFIDGNHTEVLELAQRLGLRLTAGYDESLQRRILDMGSRPTPVALIAGLAEHYQRWTDALSEMAALVSPNDPLGGPFADGLDRSPLSDLLASLQLPVSARVLIGREIRTEFMRAPDEVSQLTAALTAARQMVSGSGREAFRIGGGNDQLATGLAAALGPVVRLNSPVRSIVGRTVVLASGEEISARHVIAAVPLPVLGRMWEHMPAELAQVTYGIGGKVSVQFARRIWMDYGHSGSVLSDRAWGEMWETSNDQSGDKGVLTALLSSHDGAALVALPDTANRVVDEVDRLFPGAKALADQRVQTDWTNDPYSLGCYSTFGPGQMVAAWPAMQHSYDGVWLAGEHADALGGFMEGALRSGARTAQQILAN